MAAQYFAQIDDNNICTYVSVVTSEFLAANPERYTGTWVETFIDNPNKIYATVGYIYDAITQNFSVPLPVVWPVE